MKRMTADEFRAQHVKKQAPIRQVLGRPVRNVSTNARAVPNRPLATEFCVTLPFLPPSTNNLFVTIPNGKRVRHKAYVRFIRNCEKIIHGALDPDVQYQLTIMIEAPLFTKAGKLRKFDASNRIKAVEDVLAKRLGIDDRQFMSVLVQKHDRAVERTVVVISKLSTQVAGGGRPIGWV